MNPPSPDVVKALRERLQSATGCGITAAQEMCAREIYSTGRAWRMWEKGDRHMHPAFWELAQIKVNEVIRKNRTQT